MLSTAARAPTTPAWPTAYGIAAAKTVCRAAEEEPTPLCTLAALAVSIAALRLGSATRAASAAAPLDASQR